MMRTSILILFLFTEILSLVQPKIKEGEFSIAFIADIHYAKEPTKPDLMKRLLAAVELINQKTEEENIQLVAILGDLAWNSKANILDVIDALNKLRAPYVPIIGNADIVRWDEGAKIFSELYEPQFNKLSTELKGWKKAKVPVFDPDSNKTNYFINYAFDLNGLRIICSDWNSRLHHNHTNGLLRHQAHLYDFEGGSWQFFKQQVLAHAHTTHNKIIFLSHIPMHHSIIYPAIKVDLSAFSIKDFNTIKQFTRNYADYLAINFAGHYHYPFHQYILDAGYQLIVQSALKPLTETYNFLFYKPRIGLLKVKPKGNKFDFAYRFVMVPYEESS